MGKHTEHPLRCLAAVRAQVYDNLDPTFQFAFAAVDGVDPATTEIQFRVYDQVQLATARHRPPPRAKAMARAWVQDIFVWDDDFLGEVRVKLSELQAKEDSFVELSLVGKAATGTISVMTGPKVGIAHVQIGPHRGAAAERGLVASVAVGGVACDEGCERDALGAGGGSIASRDRGACWPLGGWSRHGLDLAPCRRARSTLGLRCVAQPLGGAERRSTLREPAARHAWLVLLARLICLSTHRSHRELCAVFRPFSRRAILRHHDQAPSATQSPKHLA